MISLSRARSTGSSSTSKMCFEMSAGRSGKGVGAREFAKRFTSLSLHPRAVRFVRVLSHQKGQSAKVSTSDSRCNLLIHRGNCEASLEEIPHRREFNAHAF